MGKVIQFPKAEREKRVDEFCELLSKHSGPREMVESEAHADAVCLRVGGLELWLTPDEAEEWAEDLIDTARDARSRGKVVPR